MSVKYYYLSFQRRVNVPAAGCPTVTIFSERAPREAYEELKKSGAFFAAYGREGASPIKDTHPSICWDTGNDGPCGVKS